MIEFTLSDEEYELIINKRKEDALAYLFDELDEYTRIAASDYDLFVLLLKTCKYAKKEEKKHLEINKHVVFSRLLNTNDYYNYFFNFKRLMNDRFLRTLYNEY